MFVELCHEFRICYGHFIVDLFRYFDLIDCIFGCFVVCANTLRCILQHLVKVQFRPRCACCILASPIKDN
jgi:hypothetical protein